MPVKTTATQKGGEPVLAGAPWTPGPHAHHWRIAEATGATSAGVCRVCGMERLFDNWEKEPEAGQRALPGAGQRHPTNAN